VQHARKKQCDIHKNKTWEMIIIVFFLGAIILYDLEESSSIPLRVS
jgi:RsiW-degrading membrane proteinase PrsW (M82 family)